MTSSAAAVPHAEVTKSRREMPRRRALSSAIRRYSASARRSASVIGGGASSPFEPAWKRTGDSSGPSVCDFFMAASYVMRERLPSVAAGAAARRSAPQVSREAVCSEVMNVYMHVSPGIKDLDEAIHVKMG